MGEHNLVMVFIDPLSIFNKVSNKWVPTSFLYAILKLDTFGFIRNHSWDFFRDISVSKWLVTLFIWDTLGDFKLLTYFSYFLGQLGFSASCQNQLAK